MLTEYAEFVLIKAAPPRELTPGEAALVHAALGLSTEILELNLSVSSENTQEEIQDLLWYSIYTATCLNIDISHLPKRLTFDRHSSRLPLRDLQASVEMLVSAIKKHVIYRKERHSELQTLFHFVWNSLLVYIDACNYSLELAIHENRKKLDTRYAAAFTSEESEVRKDKTNG